MNKIKNSVLVNPRNVDQLRSSLKKMSIYDGNGKVTFYDQTYKTNFLDILGDLDLNTINEML